MTRIERTQRILKALRDKPYELEKLSGLIEADWAIAGPFSEELYDHDLLTARLGEILEDMAKVMAPLEAS